LFEAKNLGVYQYCWNIYIYIFENSYYESPVGSIPASDEPNIQHKQVKYNMATKQEKIIVDNT